MKPFLVLFMLLFLVTPLFAQTAVTLAWDPNTETNLGGYRVYWGTASRVYGSPTFVAKMSAPTYKVTALPCAQMLYFAVTAIDTTTPTPLESGYSNEVSIKLMCAPTNLKITLTSVATNRRDATILSETNVASTMTIRYTGPEGTRTATVNFLYDVNHRITLGGLRPHSAYVFTLTAHSTEGETTTLDGSFQTT